MAIFVENVPPLACADDTPPVIDTVKLLHDSIPENVTFLDDALRVYGHVRWLDAILRHVDFLEHPAQSWDCFGRLVYAQLRRILERDFPEHIFAYTTAVFLYLYLQCPYSESYMSDILNPTTMKRGGPLTAVSRYRLLLVAEARRCEDIEISADEIHRDGHLPQDRNAFSVQDASLPMGSILQLGFARSDLTLDIMFACTWLHNHNRDWFVVVRSSLWEYVSVNDRDLCMVQHEELTGTGFTVEAEGERPLLKWGRGMVVEWSDIPDGSQLARYVEHYLEGDMIMAGADAAVSALDADYEDLPLPMPEDEVMSDPDY
ncbi:hypothetical protein LTS18_007268 [Coniosporium uncinatum]|uniref:Uncharacterized protein n=1 Tax=Coniosporium uncinatum TaxID=93489 RepID=A0ACC3DAU7_9PEZI|nr:hypothetical protein LTS18_007268 [Coniosporium uncinatum]